MRTIHATGPAERAATGSGIALTISIDTEEDNWVPARDGVTIENIRQLPRMQAWLRSLGVRPTYFTNYQVLEEAWSREIIGELHESGEAEIGGHLHPWNTPPLEEPVNWYNSMLCNLPADLQRRKIASVTERITEVLGTAPVSFRAGRFGLGRDAVAALEECGYRVDSSVTPHISWEEYNGPDHRRAPNHQYMLGTDRDPSQPHPEGRLIELPVSSGFTRVPFSRWAPVYRMLGSRALRPMRAIGVASSLGLIRQITLSPETDSVADMLTLSRCLIEEGATHLMMLFHSPTLVPGLSPFTRTDRDVDGVYRAIARYVEGLDRMTNVRFATAIEAAVASSAAHGVAAR